jgi:GDP-4-dehydro-6-deoxy-D-mannose reductase
MKALIIGGGGFVGGYLADELNNNGYDVYITCLEKVDSDYVQFNLDIRKKDDISAILSEVNPDVIFHLAAQSSVALSWKNPQLTAEINIIGAINLFEAVREYGGNPRVIVIGSGEEYGCISANSCPIKETEPLHPMNIYAATKVCQEQTAEIYARAYGLDIVMVRAFNHSGPKQESIFVMSDFCRQIADIENGRKSPVMTVGNLAAMRDFTDVRDIVRGYRLLAKKGKSGEIYNIGSGKAVSIQYILDTALKLSTVEIAVERDEKRMRASDIPIIEADTTKIHGDTGWKAEIALEQTIEDTLNYWRKRS